MEIAVYRSSRKKDTYLLLRAEDDLAEVVPDALMGQFGEATHSFSFTLTSESTLQRIDHETLRKRLEDDGFYLQLPPPENL